MSSKTVSFVIPMFNESENIEHAIGCALDALERHAAGGEILVVDDASTDDSASIVEAIAARDPRVRLLRHERNRKLGATIRTGFAAARSDLVLYMDADLPFDPDVLGQAMAAIHVTRADIIAGYRFDRTSEGLRRTVYSYLYNSPDQLERARANPAEALANKHFWCLKTFTAMGPENEPCSADACSPERPCYEA